jgi:hypothetical protein
MLAFIIIVAIILGMFLYDTLAWGLVLFKFWGWFVLPVFVTLPILTFVQALGLMLVIGLFKNHKVQTIKKQYRDSTGSNLYWWMPWLTLGFGWVAYALFIV